LTNTWLCAKQDKPKTEFVILVYTSLATDGLAIH